MALTNVEIVRMKIGLAREDNPFYDLITDEEIEYHLELYDDDVRKASMRCAHIVLLSLTMIPTREKNGDVEVWFDARRYQEALEQIISDNGRTFDLEGIVPYLAGMNRTEMNISLCDPEIVKSPLIEVENPLITSCEKQGFGCA